MYGKMKSIGTLSNRESKMIPKMAQLQAVKRAIKPSGSMGAISDREAQFKKRLK
jgi:hypothetical protein